MLNLNKYSRNHDNWTIKEDRGLATELLQNSFSIYIRKNSHPFWVTECLNFVNTLKIEKVIKIWNCDLTGGSPCTTNKYYVTQQKTR